ncbi:hypothetical protein KDN32_17765 [Nocardioides sp. J2M5]|uniref:hypothetical protein n=1 Tax=Nocardioides palaemonis TaxID=2829810 RepID=UPI001BA93812|nr:hypothetical protein [Nocardioides palaemonis]MBS2939590.1 hypothetical protein [Nocardioides palaemonis]
MSTQTPNDMFESLTGFDEIAIAAHFGDKITNLHADPFAFLRALAFVDFRRGGQNDKDAYQSAMALTISATQNYFTEDETEDEAGKEPSA